MRLGRYVLTDVLGHGAMATVFRAKDSQLGRTVAVKVMNFAVAMRDDAGERFRREAHAVASLKHPSIVEIHDFAAATDEEPAYIVVELIEGPTLRELLERRRGRFLPEVAVLIGAEVADALAVAHAHGVVHRDVKPDNVMLEATGDSSRVVITDFGVAHITGLETMTATGALVGSPAYMSPEQVRGHGPGPAADVWAMGVLLYQMVTGTLPFQGRETLTVIAAVARGTFKRPSQVAATASTELDQIVCRCLKSEPAERYPSARALAEELRKLGRAAGLGDGRATLRAFLDDPDRFEAELRPTIADAAVERARRHVRRGELAKALMEIGRATAYVPNHRGADAALKSVSARRWWTRATVAMAGAAVVFAGAYHGWPHVVRLGEKLRAPAHQADTTAPGAASQPSVPPPAPLPVPAAAPPAAPAAVVTADPPRAASEKAARPGPRKRTGRERLAARAKLAPPAPNEGDSASDAPAPPAEATAAAPPEAAPEKVPPAISAPPPPVAAAAAPQPGSVRLRAVRGLCSPSLDEERARGPTIVDYPQVTPGKHKVYCTVNNVRALVGEVEVRPGQSRELAIKMVDGKPRF